MPVHWCLLQGIVESVDLGLMAYHDHGSHYLSGIFQTELACLSIQSSVATVEKLRVALMVCIALHSDLWMSKPLVFESPSEAAACTVRTAREARGLLNRMITNRQSPNSWSLHHANDAPVANDRQPKLA